MSSTVNEALHRVVLSVEPQLDLRGSIIGPAGAVALCAALRSNHVLTSLDLYDTGLDDTSVDRLCHALLEHGLVTSLDMGGNELTAGATRALAALPRKLPAHKVDGATASDLDWAAEEEEVVEKGYDYGPPVRELRLSRNRLDGAACGALLSAGRRDVMLALESLALSLNPLGESGGAAIGDAMGHMPHLHTLQLHGCGLGPKGAQALAGGLVQSRQLAHLDLSDNSLSDEGAQAVAAELPHTHLEELLLSRNRIAAAGAAALANALMRRRGNALRLLGLHGNKLRDAAAVSLAEALGAPAVQGNRSLETLDLSANKLGEEGALRLGDAIVTNPTLTSLDLRGNRRVEEGVIRAIDGLLAHNRAGGVSARPSSCVLCFAAAVLSPPLPRPRALQLRPCAHSTGIEHVRSLSARVCLYRPRCSRRASSKPSRRACGAVARGTAARAQPRAPAVLFSAARPQVGHAAVEAGRRPPVASGGSGRVRARLVVAGQAGPTHCQRCCSIQRVAFVGVEHASSSHAPGTTPLRSTTWRRKRASRRTPRFARHARSWRRRNSSWGGRRRRWRRRDSRSVAWRRRSPRR